VTTETALFILRLLSAALLFAMLGVTFYVIWREYITTLRELESNRRSYGQLLLLQELDGSYVMMGEMYPLHPMTTFGRSPGNNVVVDDSFASSEHALIVLRNGQWWLEDRRSRNGTTLNEIPITQSVVVTNGDIIGIGSQRFKLELER
jgi:hypothetical protein